MMDELSNIKSSLQDNIWNAYKFGIQLPEGCVAFYDEHKKCFVDGGSLKPLEGEFAVMTACTNAKPKDKPYKLADSGGLYLLVNPTGSKLWRLKYYFLQKERLFSIGAFP